MSGGTRRHAVSDGSYTRFTTTLSYSLRKFARDLLCHALALLPVMVTFLPISRISMMKRLSVEIPELLRNWSCRRSISRLSPIDPRRNGASGGSSHSPAFPGGGGCRRRRSGKSPWSRGPSRRVRCYRPSALCPIFTEHELGSRRHADGIVFVKTELKTELRAVVLSDQQKPEARGLAIIACPASAARRTARPGLSRRARGRRP